jgi:predicted PurR-regulated permease PerM
MVEESDNSIITPGAIVVALVAFLTAATSLAFNPFFAVSVIAVAFAIMTLRAADRVENYIVQGILRIFGVIAILGGVGGAVVLAFPTLGLPVQ